MLVKAIIRINRIGARIFCSKCFVFLVSDLPLNGTPMGSRFPLSQEIFSEKNRHLHFELFDEKSSHDFGWL